MNDIERNAIIDKIITYEYETPKIVHIPELRKLYWEKRKELVDRINGSVYTAYSRL